MTGFTLLPIDPEDWFDRGKTDAWLGQPKLAPEHDPKAASWYDLGYGEGITQPSPIALKTTIPTPIPA
jgi:hypothetical protein